MKQVMKSLMHNGVYVPPYDYKGFSVRICGQTLKLAPMSEQIAIAWIRKRQSVASSPDRVFYRNFIQDFLDQLESENPSLSFLESFRIEHLKSIDAPDFGGLSNEKVDESGIDFSEVVKYVDDERAKKQNMNPVEKKQLTLERKKIRDGLREKLGYAVVDGVRLEIANWTAEPSCLFAGRGDHPKRGKWKRGPREEEIILNLSPDSPRPEGNWKDVVWEPSKMYVAKWEDKLTGKIKYVWFSDSAFLKQNREKEKFEKAEKLGRQIAKIEDHIMKNLDSDDVNRRKTATVCWLILKPNMRVGDEKDPDEADTVGAITLRAEHIKIEGQVVHFDFLGKDSVRWVKHIEASPVVIRNIDYFMRNSREYLFEGIDSKHVSRFLSEKMPGLSAKVFRTWRCTATVREYLDKSGVGKEDPDYIKLYAAKIANLKVAEVANHKRKVPPTYNNRLAKKNDRIGELRTQLKMKQREGKKIESLKVRIEKAVKDLELMKLTEEYNLGTSLKSYIDPRAYVKWSKRVDFALEKFYPKTLRKKFSWALGKVE